MLDLKVVWGFKIMLVYSTLVDNFGFIGFYFVVILYLLKTYRFISYSCFSKRLFKNKIYGCKKDQRNKKILVIYRAKMKDIILNWGSIDVVSTFDSDIFVLNFTSGALYELNAYQKRKGDGMAGAILFAFALRFSKHICCSTVKLVITSKKIGEIVTYTYNLNDSGFRFWVDIVHYFGMLIHFEI